MTYLIVHPITGDRAYALDRGGAEQAARTLRNDAVDQGCSPVETCTITRVEGEVV